MTSRPILAATDFSIPAKAAVARAAQLAESLDVPLHLLHVMELEIAIGRTPLPKGWRTSFVGVPQDRGDEFVRLELAEKQLAELGRRARPARVLRRYGKAWQQIIRAVRSQQARLVVVGVHQPRGASERLLLGTTAERVLRSASRPVLVVRRRDDKPYRRALVPIDFSTVSQNQLAALRDVAPDARVTLLHVVPTRTKRDMKSEARLREAALRIARKAGFATSALAFVVEDGDPRAAILRTETEDRPDLLVIGTRGRTGIARLLLGSVAEHVLRAATSDVLAVPPLV
jgi:nucleotide-binding universal stress UspA family protein